MNNKIGLGIVALLALTFILGIACSGLCRWSKGYGMMGAGMMGFGMGWLWIIFFIILVVGAFLLFSNGKERSKPSEILDERFVRGEITKEQYDEMKKILE